MFGSARLFSVLVFHVLCSCVIETGRIKRVIGGKEVICGKFLYCELHVYILFQLRF